MKWFDFDKFCSRFDGAAAKLSDWWHGVDSSTPNYNRRASSGSSTGSKRSELEERTLVAANRILKHAEEADKIRRRAHATVANEPGTLLELLDEDIQEALEIAADVKAKIEGKQIDVYKLLNMLQDRDLSAKPDVTEMPDERTAKRWVYNLALKFVCEARIGQLEGYVSEESAASPIRASEIIAKKKEIREEISRLDRDYDSPRATQDALTAVRTLMPDELRPTRTNLRSGARTVSGR